MSQSSADSPPAELEICIDIPSSFSPEVLQNLQENVRTSLAWANSQATDMVRRMIANGSLPRNDKQAERAYRSKVMVQMLGNRSRWLTASLDSAFNNVTDIRKSELTGDYFANCLKNLGPPPPDSAGFSAALRRTADQVLSAPPSSVTSVSFFLTVSYFKYDENLGSVRVAVQVFNIALKATHYVVMDPPPSAGLFSSIISRPVDMIKVEPDFSVTQYSFNNRMFEAVKSEIEDQLRRAAGDGVGE